MRLEENERGNITRLMKVKDMMIRARARHDDEDESDEDENF
jgi:vacuolar-type H+-ATPase subunit D/Vma8